jgi:hypothetical protein
VLFRTSRSIKQKNILTVLGEGFQNINGAIVCSFTNSASTADVTPEQQHVLTCELINIGV